jgi:pimeloyl-ACP methyl ester carboxylesterase
MTTKIRRYLFAAAIQTFLAAGLSTASFGQSAEYDVPFLTVRDIGSENGPSPYFGDARSTLRAGRCLAQRADTGGLLAVLDNGPAFIREQLLSINKVDVQLPADLLDSVQAEHSGSPALYVHGYAISFEKGCRRAALLQRNAGLDGRMVWFTWPSDGDVANYVQDEVDLYWSVPDIADAIIELNTRSVTDSGVDVIGHSLGGRGVALALQDIAYRFPEIRLGKVVLLAPDMDFEIFARLAPRIASIAESITIYVNDEDRPLALSAQLHGYPRLGQAANDVAALGAVEVIEVSRLPDESASGHLYHIHNTKVGSDLDQLLNEGLHASERTGLLQIGPNAWSLVPD